MVHWWCNANLEWVSNLREVRVFDNLFFYNMNATNALVLDVPFDSLGRTFARVAIILSGIKGVAVKQYRPLI